MNLQALGAAIEATPVGDYIAGSSWAFPTIETIHVISLVTVFGTVAIMDLRLLGLASKSSRMTEIEHDVLPWTWGAWLCALVTGSLLFTSRAADYMNISAFPAKFVFMAIAGLNMVYFHFATQKTIGQWDSGEPTPAAKMAGAVSLAMWAMVVICARQVGFHL